MLGFLPTFLSMHHLDTDLRNIETHEDLRQVIDRVPNMAFTTFDILRPGCPDNMRTFGVPVRTLVFF